VRLAIDTAPDAGVAAIRMKAGGFNRVEQV
jgi:hypothetical protein